MGLRRFSGMRRTRQTVAEDVAMLRRAKADGEHADGQAVAQGEERAQIPADSSR